MSANGTPAQSVVTDVDAAEAVADRVDRRSQHTGIGSVGDECRGLHARVGQRFQVVGVPR